MKNYIPKIAENVYYIGSKDFNRKMFDSFISLPNGTSYNSYLIIDKKNVVIDTVNPGFENEFFDKIDKICGIENIDYLIMNHAEPDHANAIKFFFNKNKKATLLTSQKGMELAKLYFKVPAKRIKTIKDNEIIKIGKNTFQFISAPYLHWPETIFTFLKEEKILFSGDFFGSHLSEQTFDDQMNECLFQESKKYFGEIMMPFRIMGKSALQKIKSLEINTIAPSHGPIYKTPKRIINLYKKWTKGETEIKVNLIYVSMWKSTEKMIFNLNEELLKRKIDTKIFNLEVSDKGEIIKNLVDARYLILGAPTVIGRSHPLMFSVLNLINILKPPIKKASIVSSSGWSGGAVMDITKNLKLTDLEIVKPIDIIGPPKKSTERLIQEMAEEFV